jgi:hypothetical protein
MVRVRYSNLFVSLSLAFLNALSQHRREKKHNEKTV